MCDSHSNHPVTEHAPSKKNKQGTLWIPGAILTLMFLAGLLVGYLK